MVTDLRSGGSMVWQTSPGYRTVPIPTSPAAPQPGDIALIRASFESDRKLGPRGSAWTATGYDIWWKRLTSDDLSAGSVVVDGMLTGMTVLLGCRGVGRISLSNGVRLTEAGAGVYTYAWSPKWSNDILGWPTPGLLGDDIELVGRRQWACHWFRSYTTTGSKYLPEDDSAEGYRSFEMLPTKSPNPPILTAPIGGTNLNVAAGFSLQIIHQSNGGLTQEGYSARLRLVGAGVWQYVTSTGTLTTTATVVPSSANTLPVAAGLAAGAYEWSAATMDGGVLGEFSIPETFVLVGVPTVTPSFTTSHGSMTPDGSWARTTPGGTQTAWRAVFAPAGAGVSAAVWESGTVLGSGSAVSVSEEGWVGAPWSWVNSGSYDFWVQIQQTGGLWSAWTAAAAPRTVSWTPPGAPGAVTPVDGSPFHLSVTGVSPTAMRLEIEQKVDGEWFPLTNVVGPGASNTVDIPGAPYNIARVYRARAWAIVSGVAVYSGWVTSASVASTDEGSYFISTGGEEWIRVSVRSDGETTVIQGIDVSNPLTGPDADPRYVVPMVERTKTGGTRGQMELQVFYWEDLEALEEWVTTHKSWDYRRTPEKGTDGLLRHVSAVRMGQAGNIRYARRAQTNTSIRSFVFDYVKQK